MARGFEVQTSLIFKSNRMATHVSNPKTATTIIRGKRVPFTQKRMVVDTDGKSTPVTGNWRNPSVPPKFYGQNKRRKV